jgi:hypothetical protein
MTVVSSKGLSDSNTNLLTTILWWVSSAWDTLKKLYDMILLRVRFSDIEDTLTSTSTWKVLSANQWKILKDALDTKQATINVSPSRALISDSTGALGVSAVTSTELGYLDGVTSSVQTQLNGKQTTITGWADTITTSNLTANRALLSNSSGKVAVSAVTSTELGYLDGVTSSVQTQLNGKQATIAGWASTITTSNLTVNRALLSNSSGKVAVSAVTSTELGYLDGVTSSVQTQLDAVQPAHLLIKTTAQDVGNWSYFTTTSRYAEEYDPWNKISYSWTNITLQKGRYKIKVRLIANNAADNPGADLTTRRLTDDSGTNKGYSWELAGATVNERWGIPAFEIAVVSSTDIRRIKKVSSSGSTPQYRAFIEIERIGNY